MSSIQHFLKRISSDNTRRAYKRDLIHFSSFIEKSIGEWDSAQIRSEDIERFIRSMASEGLSKATQRRRLAAIRQFHEWLVNEGTISHNPASSISLSSSKNSSESTNTRVLDKDQIERLLMQPDRSTKKGYRDYTLVLVILYGSLRRGEVASLNVEDVRPLGRYWVIDLAEGTQGRGGYVKIPDAVAEAVQKLADLHGVDSGPLWQSFSNRNFRQRLGSDAIYTVIRDIGHRADLGDVSIDTLRRSGLHLASVQGARFEHIQQHARLATPSATSRYMSNERGSGKLQNPTAEILELDAKT